MALFGSALETFRSPRKSLVEGSLVLAVEVRPSESESRGGMAGRGFCLLGYEMSGIFTAKEAVAPRLEEEVWTLVDSVMARVALRALTL